MERETLRRIPAPRPAHDRYRIPSPVMPLAKTRSQTCPWWYYTAYQQSRRNAASGLLCFAIEAHTAFSPSRPSNYGRLRRILHVRPVDSGTVSQCDEARLWCSRTGARIYLELLFTTAVSYVHLALSPSFLFFCLKRLIVSAYRFVH